MKTNVESQIDKFRRAARELECDDDEDHFDEMARRIVRPLDGDGVRRDTSPKEDSNR